MTSPTVLHICGRACGQPGSGRDGHRHLGSRRAGDPRPARRGDLEHVVPGGPAARARRRRPRPRGPEHRGLRAHPLELQRHARGHAEGRDRSRAAGRAARRHRGPGRRTGADGRAPDRRADPRRGPAASQRDDLGAGDAQSPLHVRPVRHRCLEPLRPRGRALGRRDAGPGLQPAVHLRAGRSRQDPPPARDRPPRAGDVRQEARPLHVDRVVHERLRRGDPRRTPDAGVPAPLPRARRAADRRHPVPRAQPAAPGGVLPHVQPAPRRGRPDRHLVGPAAELHRHASRTACGPGSSGD